MATIQTMTSNVRLRCDDPLPNKVSVRRILLAVVDSLQTFYARLGNTGQAWSLKPDYLLNVSAQSSAQSADFLLAVDDSYGKPIQVLTYYPINPSYSPRFVDFREFSDMNFDWGLPANIASYMYTDGSNCTAMRMAFYYQDDGSRWVRVLPAPTLQASYLVTFESGDWTSTAALESSAVLTQFHSLIEIWASRSILPSCQWWDDQDANIAHRKEIKDALASDEARIGDEFDRYCRNLIQDHMTIRSSSMDADGIGVGGW
jgi:hypothetical protein